MKIIAALSAAIVVVLMFANGANAASPREQLKQLATQLRESPDDDALREKIVKLGAKLKPAPAVPEEAEKFEGRAQFAFKNAKSPAGYLKAAQEYEKAAAVAPWVSGYYSDLCTIYEKAEKYEEAKKNCGFFLASEPSAPEASDTRKRIAGLEFAMENAGSPEAPATSKNDRKEKTGIEALAGNWRQSIGGQGGCDSGRHLRFEVKDGELEVFVVMDEFRGGTPAGSEKPYARLRLENTRLVGKLYEITRAYDEGYRSEWEVSSDFKKLTERMAYSGQVMYLGYQIEATCRP